VPDFDREEAVGDEVVELEHITDGGGKGGALYAELFGIFNTGRQSLRPQT